VGFETLNAAQRSTAPRPRLASSRRTLTLCAVESWGRSGEIRVNRLKGQERGKQAAPSEIRAPRFQRNQGPGFENAAEDEPELPASGQQRGRPHRWPCCRLSKAVASKRERKEGREEGARTWRCGTVALSQFSLLKLSISNERASGRVRGFARRLTGASVNVFPCAYSILPRPCAKKAIICYGASSRSKVHCISSISSNSQKRRSFALNLGEAAGWRRLLEP